jgi:hypothetical protein
VYGVAKLKDCADDAHGTVNCEQNKVQTHLLYKRKVRMILRIFCLICMSWENFIVTKLKSEMHKAMGFQGSNSLVLRTIKCIRFMYMTWQEVPNRVMSCCTCKGNVHASSKNMKCNQNEFHSEIRDNVK